MENISSETTTFNLQLTVSYANQGRIITLKYLSEKSNHIEYLSH